MFDETIRALQQLDGTTSISVPISYDEEGYFDRECPSEECQFQFKVHLEDWKAKVRDEEVFCPFCGHSADSTEWNTEEQLEHIKQLAHSHLQSTVGSALKRDAARWNRRQPRNNFISMTMKVGNRPQHVALPPAAAEPMRLKIVCSVCECRYAVIGAAYFCPSCGHNAADHVFALTIAGIRKSLEALSEVRAAIPDPDTAENTSRLIVESGLQSAVTAFQRCAEAFFANLPTSPTARRNAFQNLAEGSQLWQAETGKSYRDHLSEDELDRLTRSFQQRHLLAHTQGIVDEDYLRKRGLSGFRNENTPEIHKLAAVETAISYHRAMPDGVWAVGGLVCAEDGQPFLYPTRGFQLVAAVLALCTRSPLAAKSTDCPCAVQP